MKPNQHENTLATQTASERALEKAIAHLAAKGIIDPILMPKSDLQAWHAEIDAYRKQLAEMIVQYLRSPSGPRPIENIRPDPISRSPNREPLKAKPYPPKQSYTKQTRDFTGDYNDD